MVSLRSAPVRVCPCHHRGRLGLRQSRDQCGPAGDTAQPARRADHPRPERRQARLRREAPVPDAGRAPGSGRRRPVVPGLLPGRVQPAFRAAQPGGESASGDTAGTAAHPVARQRRTALGDTACGKELIEAYAGNGVVRIEDFRRLAIAGQGRARKRRPRGGQDKGHRAELRAFVEAVIAGGPPPIDEAQLVNSSLATIVALESLGKGVRIRLGVDLTRRGFSAACPSAWSRACFVGWWAANAQPRFASRSASSSATRASAARRAAASRSARTSALRRAAASASARTAVA